MASKTLQPSAIGKGPGVTILIRSRVGEDGNLVLKETENHQGRSPTKHLRVSDLIRAMSGVNWAITDRTKVRIHIERSRQGFSLTIIVAPRVEEGHVDFLKELASSDVFQHTFRRHLIPDHVRERL